MNNQKCLHITSERDAHDSYKALYLHIPFCAQRCVYCDFVTEAISLNDPQIDRYIEQLITDIRRATRADELGSVKTIYLGGGTPSYLGSRRLVNLVYTLSLSLNLTEDVEFTVEANPESLTAPLVRDLFSLGVTRFSVGVQSLIDDELQTLGRLHDAQTAAKAISIARERCENVSLDLICGIPGQTNASWYKTLQKALQLGINHISIYPLTLEEDTPLALAVANGDIVLASEDNQAQMMVDAARYLSAQGFERYEVSSYARPGYQCAHNIAYWTGQSYLGLGRGAAGMRNTQTGRERFYEGAVIEQLNQTERCLEDLFLGMRMAEGVNSADVARAVELSPQIATVFAELESDGLVKLQDGRYRPTERGWLLGNQIFQRIWSLAGE